MLTGPGRVAIRRVVEGEAGLVGAVGVHGVDFGVPVAAGDECDLVDVTGGGAGVGLGVVVGRGVGEGVGLGVAVGASVGVVSLKGTTA